MSFFTNTFIYYPVSAILWFWHKIFGFIIGPDSGFSWALAVVFLVFSLRLILVKPFIKTIHTTRQMQELQPKMAAIKKKYGKDRQKYALEIQKLQKEQGFNPLLGCLPALLQIPMFMGLYHVLSSFNRTTPGFGRTVMTIEQTRNTPNYIFNVSEVQSFLDSRFFGIPISSFLTQKESAWRAFLPSPDMPIDFTRLNILWVVIPVVLVSAIATHMNSRAAVARQSPEAQTNEQTAIMNFMTLWIFPLGVLVMAPFMPVANLLYWLSNNVWTYGQQHLVFKNIEKKEALEKEKKLEVQATLAPKPGTKPNVDRKKRNN